MVGESDVGGVNLAENYKNIPISYKSKPFHIQPGMHHLEKLDSQDSVEEDIKDIEQKVEEAKKGRRLDELKKTPANNFNGGAGAKSSGQGLQGASRAAGLANGHHGGYLAKSAAGGGGATRTLQPIKGFDLGALIEQDQKEQQQDQLN